LKSDTIIWSEFRYENNYDESMTTCFPDVGPFAFDVKAYRRVLGEVAE